MMFHSARDLSQAPPKRGRYRGIRSWEVRSASFRVRRLRFLLVKAGDARAGDSARFLRVVRISESQSLRVSPIETILDPRKFALPRR